MRAPDRLSLVARDNLAEPTAVAWDALVDRIELSSPFLRSWWLEAVATNDVCYLLLEDDGHLIGGVPLARDRWLGITRYRFVGQGVLSPDHLDLMAAPGREEQVVEAFGAWFRAAGSRYLDLVGLPAGSLAHRAVGGRERLVEVAPYEQLPPTWSDYLAARSSNFRRDLRRSQRRLTRAGLVHRRVGPEGLAGALTAFTALHRARADRGELLSEIPRLAAAIEAGLARGEIRVDVAEITGQVAGVSVTLVSAGRLSAYQVARSMRREHKNVSTVLLAHVIEEAIDAGCHELDMLRGAEPYKIRFASQRRELFGLRVGHGVPARLFAFARDLLTLTRVRWERLRKSGRRTKATKGAAAEGAAMEASVGG